MVGTFKKLETVGENFGNHRGKYTKIDKRKAKVQLSLCLIKYQTINVYDLEVDSNILVSCAHWIGGLVGPQSGLDFVT
jgi:hypothetical protein